MRGHGAVVAALLRRQARRRRAGTAVGQPVERRGVALVRKQPCAGGWCETIWLGTTRADAVQVASLSAGSEHCDEIAWAADGFRVGFVVNGYQLRIFDGVGRKPINQVNLIEPDGTPIVPHRPRRDVFAERRGGDVRRLSAGAFGVQVGVWRQYAKSMFKQ